MAFTSDIADEMLKACLENGLLVNNVKPNAIRFIPPFIITEADIDEALAILEKVFQAR